MNVFRKLVVNFPLYKNDIIAYVCDYLCDEKFFYHKSIENYVMKEKPTFNRKLYYHLNNKVFITFMLKYLLFMMYPSENLKIEFREVIFNLMSRENKIAYIYINLLCLCTIMLKLMIFYFEIKYKVKGLTFLWNLAEELPFYKSNINEQDIFQLLTNILFIYLKLILR